MKKCLLGFLILSCLLFLGVKKAEANTINATQTGVTISPTNVAFGQSAAVYGFSVATNTGTTNLSTVVYNATNGYLTDLTVAGISLVSSNTADYTTSTTLSPVIATLATTATKLTFTVTTPSSQPLSTTKKYYFLVVTYNGAGSPPDTFTFGLTNVTSSSAGNDNDNTTHAYTFYSGILTQDQTTGGLTANPLNVTQTNVVLSGISLKSAGTSTLTGISYVATQRISNYFTGTAALYSSTSSTWLGTGDPSSTLLQSKAIPTNTTALAFTFPTQTITNGVTMYYYIVLSNYSPPATSATFEFDVNALTTGAATLPAYNDKTGSTFNLNATSLTENQITAGLVADPLAVPLTNVAISGISLTATGNTTVSGISYAATRNMSTYFTGNATLYSSTSSTWLGTTDPSSTLLQTKAMPANMALAFTFTPQTINNGVTMYYYVILDNYSPPGTTTTFGLNVNAVTGTTTTYNNKTGTVYNLPATTLAAASITAGLAPTTLTTSQNDIAIDGISLTATGNNTFTSIKFTSTPTGGNISPNFTSVSLYSSTSSSFPGVGSASLLQTITALGTNAVTFTGLTETINDGVTKYYYLVVNYNQPPSNASFQFNSPTITGAVLTGTATGQTYTLTAPTLTEASVTGGLAANPITGNQTNLAILGMSLSANSGTASFTALTFTAVTNPTGGVINSYFSGNVTLYSSTSSSFPGIGDPSLTAIATKAAPNTAGITFTGLTQTITNGTTMYYYVVMAANTPPAVSTTFQLNLSTVTGPNTAGSASGPNYTLTPAVTFGTASTTGLATNPLNFSQTGIALLGFSINTTVSKTFSQINLTYALSNGTFTTDFSNFKLYVNTTGNTLAGATQVTGAIFTPGTNTLRITGLSQTIPSTTYSYFIVADFNDPANSATVHLSAASAVATATYSNGAPIDGNVYNIGPATNNWIGGSGGNDWNVAANWSYGVVPLPSDHVQIGVDVTFPVANSPIISTPVTIASIDAASNGGSGAISLMVNNTLTVNGDITVSSDGDSHGSQTFNLTGTGAVNAADIVVDDDFNFNFAFNVSVNSSVTTLKVTNNISLITAAFIIYAESATFNLTGGTATVGGPIKTSNFELSFIPSTATLSVSNATLILTNAAALSALDGDGNNVISFNNAGSTVQYSGAAQTIYTTGAISGLGTGPSYRNLIIAGTGAKTLITGGSLNIAGDYTNSLTNDATNNITLTNNQVNFNGASAQTINGGIGTGTIFNNVAFSGNSTKTLSTGTFTVINTGAVTVGATGSGNTSTLAVASGIPLTLNSNGTSTATVNPIFGSITGNVTVQRFVTGGSSTYRARGYRLFSSPTNVNNVINQTTTQAIVDPTFLNNYMLTGGPGSGFDLVTANPLTYLYDDTRASSAYKFYSGKNVGLYSIAGSPAYTVTIYNTNGSVLATPLKVPVGNSFMVYYTGTSSLSNPYPESTTVNCTGVLNQGKIPVWLFNSTGAATQSLVIPGTNATGMNQVGNPYASTISLHQLYVDNNLLHAGNISPVFYEFDPTGSLSGTYLSYNSNTYTTSSTNRSSNYIVSGQGFLVQAVGTFPLVFQEGEKVAYPSIVSSATSGGALLMDIPTTVSNNDITSQSFAQAAPPSATTNAAQQLTPEQQAQNALVGLHLQLAKDSTVLTQTGIYFSSKWTDLYSVMEDAIDRDGTAPQVFLSSYSTDGKRLSINQLADYTKGKRIKLYTGATASGTYTFSLADILNIDTINYTVFLVDHKMNDSLDMVKYKTYAFNITTADTTTFGANRFTLVIERHALPPYSLISFSGQKVNNGIQLNWKTLNEGNYTNFALQKLGGSNTYASIYTTQGNGSGLYSYVDAHPVNGNNTYRLQQTDIDGRVTYSMPVTINYKNNLQNGALTVYPNPAKSIINVSLNTNGPGSSNYIVDIYNTSGTVIDHKIVNTNSWTQDVSNYKLGVYVIEIKTSNGNLVGNTKFVKIIN